MTTYVRGANPIWWLPDLVGQPLNDEYYAHFLQNTLPYLPEPVYRNPNGTAIWTGGVVQFEPAGTLPNNLYFDPNKVYRIEIRRGNTQTDPLIYEINDYVPNDNGGDDNNVILSTNNQIANSQFAFINFVSPLAITTSGTYNIAPGWVLELVGTGTATLTQIDFEADANNINKPPFGMRFNLNGWTSATLYQRFNMNGGIWASVTLPVQNTGVAVSVTGQAETVAQNISIYYKPSSGTEELLASGTLETGFYQVLQGAITMPPSDNTQLNSVAYVDIQIILPPTGIVDLSNIQVVGQDVPLPISYEQETIERQKDHLFHYYADELILKPKDDILVGWNFSENPYQFISSTLATKSTQVGYIADQTILRQLGASTLQSGQASAANRYCLQIKAVNGQVNNRFALIQYIDPRSIGPYWSYILSSLVRARIVTTHATQCHIKMRLIWRTDLPAAVSATEPILSWTAGQDPTFSAGWTALTPLNDPSYLLPNAYEDGTYNRIPAVSFDRFQLPNASTTTMTLGIVLYTMDNIDQTSGTEDSILFDRVSLIPNLFACDTNPKTFDQVVRECQFYYEKSYDISTLPGSVTFASANAANIPGNTPGILQLAGLQRPFKVPKRATPTMKWFSPATGSSDRVRDVGTPQDLTVTGTSSPGINSTGYPVTNTPTPIATWIAEAHWEAATLLGV